MKKFLFFVALFLSFPAHADYQIVVSKQHQAMSVYENGELFDVWPVSTARRGVDPKTHKAYSTPTGTFRPYSYQPIHYSKKYDNAPMPHSIFFSGGYAIHATPHVAYLGRPASHGCVRLSPENAATLYEMTKGEPTTITIQ